MPPPPPPIGPPLCTSTQLDTTGVRGGAFQGREIAGVIFTNTSATRCSMSGYPFAQLRFQGHPLGRPATPDNTGVVTAVVLARHGSAQVQLTAVSTCQAPISDHVRVRAAGMATPAIVAVQLRGCALSVGPLQRG